MRNSGPRKVLLSRPILRVNKLERWLQDLPQNHKGGNKVRRWRRRNSARGQQGVTNGTRDATKVAGGEKCGSRRQQERLGGAKGIRWERLDFSFLLFFFFFVCVLGGLITGNSESDHRRLLGLSGQRQRFCSSSKGERWGIQREAAEAMERPVWVLWWQ